MTGLLVTGTDTGVGKTWVSCQLARALREEGLRVGVMKPCETGITARGDEVLPRGCDAALLQEASGCEADPKDILPYRFALPAAPSVSAEEEGARIELDTLLAAFSRLQEDHDLVLVEGAGGLLVPLAEGLDFLGLATTLELEVLVVARTGLGTVNHIALTDRVLRAEGFPPVGVVLNSPTTPVSGSDRANLGALGLVLEETRVLAELPHGDAPPVRVLAPLVEAVRERLRV